MRTPLHGLRAPYSLPSNVIYFTDWRYVYTGGVAWSGPDGKHASVWASEDVPGGFRWDPVDMPTGIRIRARKAQKVEVNLKRDKPWERMMGWSNLMYDGGLYRAWYSACPPSGFATSVPNQTDFLCYAESEDGLTWRKPSLGIAAFEGTADTNIVFGGEELSGEQGCHGATVFKDPSASPEERYKLIYLGDVPESEFEEYRRTRPDDIDPYSIRKDIGKVFGVYGATSPDGIKWTRIPGPLVIQHSDTQTTAYYDTALKKYVAYFRSWYFDRRCVGRAETDNFRRWPVPENILCPGAELAASDQWYTNARTIHPGASDYHLMFPALYRQSEDSTEIYMLSSADGIVWSLVPGGPVLSPGEPGSKDAGCIFAGHGLVELPGERVGIPCTAYSVPHKYPRTNPLGDMVLATWQKGRLAALEAPEQGEFALAQLFVKGSHVLLNVSTKHAGEVRVEAVDAKGNPLPGRGFADSDPISGDFLRKEVTWRGEANIGHDPSMPLRLRFRMCAAELFGVEFVQ